MALCMGFIAIGLAMLIRSFSYVGARKSIRFDKDTITVRDSSILHPARHWQTPYGDFEGVVMRQIEEDVDKQTNYFQIIELLHSDHRHTVSLYIQSEAGSPEQALMEYSQRLSLPAFRARTIMTDSLEPFEDYVSTSADQNTATLRAG